MEEPWTALAPKLTMEDVADRCVLLQETGDMVFGVTEQEACERIAANVGLSIPWATAGSRGILTRKFFKVSPLMKEANNI